MANVHGNRMKRSSGKMADERRRKKKNWENCEPETK